MGAISRVHQRRQTTPSHRDGICLLVAWGAISRVHQRVGSTFVQRRKYAIACWSVAPKLGAMALGLAQLAGWGGGAEGIRTPDFLRAKEALSRTELQPHAGRSPLALWRAG